MESNRRVRKRLRKLVKHLLVLAIAVIAIFDVWQSSCALPTEESFSRAISLSYTQFPASEAELIGILYSEMSKELARLGSIDVVSGRFENLCQIDSCYLGDARLSTRITFHPLCACKIGRTGQLATVWSMADITAAYIQLSTVRTVSSETTWSPDRISDIATVKEFALRSIEDDVWDLHPELWLLIKRRRGGWSFKVRNVWDSPDYFSSGQLDDSDILRMKEQKQ